MFTSGFIRKNLPWFVEHFVCQKNKGVMALRRKAVWLARAVTAKDCGYEWGVGF